MMMYLFQQPELLNKVKDEFNRVVIQPYMEANPGKKVDVMEALNFDNAFDLKFYNQCFQESLRMEPPVKASSSIMVLEDLDIGAYHIKKYTPM